jgi:hypothetical protein
MMNVGTKLRFQGFHPAVGRVGQPGLTVVAHAPLDDEARGDAVKTDMIIPTLRNEIQELPDVLGRPLWHGLQRQGAESGFHCDDAAQLSGSGIAKGGMPLGLNG